VVAQKFFPVEDVEGMYPLCERDYFARLDLICTKCDQALRSSYITACGESRIFRFDASLRCHREQVPCRALYMYGLRRSVWAERLVL